MRARRRATRPLTAIAFAFAFALALPLAGGAGCSLLVGGDVPDFQCIDGNSACPSGQRCDIASKRCVSTDGSAPPPAEAGDDGPSDDARDAGKEADAGPADLGSKCRLDAECKSMLCASSTILTTAITQSTGPICTSTCCTSLECPLSFVCFNGGTGGGYCVPAVLAQRSPPATGGKGGGLSCTTNDQCRSGLCTGSPKTCLDTCCIGTDCGGSSVCRTKSVTAPPPSHDFWVCAAPEGTAFEDAGDSCNTSAECKTDTCIPAPGGLCRPPCSNTASCRALGAPFTNGHCVYGTSGADSFRFCQATTFVARLPAGQPCTGVNSECQSDLCDAELKKCSNACGKDADCLATESCRPSGVSTPLLRCVPKP